MGLVGNIITRITLTAMIPAIGFFVAEKFAPKQYRPSQMVHMVEVYKQKRANPLASHEEIEHALASGEAIGKTRVEDMIDGEQAAALKEQGPEIVVEGNGYTDPTGVDRILKMNIPEHMKREILANYERTGILPAIVSNETSRGPASVTGAQDSSKEQTPEVR